MATRAELHKLVDALAENVFEHAERVLSHCLSWPQPSPDVTELKERVRQRSRQVEMAGRHNAYDRRVPGNAQAESRCIPPGTGYVSHISWIDDELVQVTLLRVRGQGVERVERVGLKEHGSEVQYSVEVVGPDGKNATFKAQFYAGPA